MPALLVRLVAGIVGNYAFVWAATVLLVTGLAAAGMPYADAQQTGFLAGFLLYLVLFLWAFVARRLTAVVLVLVAGSGALLGLSYLVLHAIAGA